MSPWSLLFRDFTRKGYKTTEYMFSAQNVPNSIPNRLGLAGYLNPWIAAEVSTKPSYHSYSKSNLQWKLKFSPPLKLIGVVFFRPAHSILALSL